jgi:hypothetical protein
MMSSFFQSWGFWLLLIVGTFGIHEGWALATGHQTLTAFTRSTTLRFPAIIFLLGILVGWAFMHFWGAGWCG